MPTGTSWYDIYGTGDDTATSFEEMAKNNSSNSSSNLNSNPPGYYVTNNLANLGSLVPEPKLPSLDDPKVKADLKKLSDQVKGEQEKQYKEKYGNNDELLNNDKNRTSIGGSSVFDGLSFDDAVGSDFTEANTIGQSTRESILEKGRTLIDIPDWGYKDFINERIDWLKGTKSMLGEPAWFYFKIFFKFDSNHGLLGGVFNNPNYDNNVNDVGTDSTNTAIKYLQRIANTKRYNGDTSNMINMNYGRNKVKYLYNFIRTLAFISCDAPWFFSAVHDVNNALASDFNDLTKEKSITIDCLEDAIDMRLLTMMDLYRHACFDDVMQKEIVPENLRKFDMDIIVFQSPIRYLHTSAIDLRSRKTSYKTLNADDFGTRMSFKLFSFKNCEFDFTSLPSMLPSTFTNDKPFTSKPTIKINYDRVYQHTSNEFAGLLFGSGGTTDYYINNLSNNTVKIKSNNPVSNAASKLLPKTSTPKGDLYDAGQIREVNVIGSKQQSASGETGRRKSQLKYLHEHPTYYNLNSNVYKALVDASETKISSAMRMIDSSAAFGNLYGTGKSLGDTIASDVKGVLKTAGNAYKNMGKSFVNKWKF